MKKAAIIEFNPYHDECLYSQINFLNSAGYSLTLVVSSQIEKRVLEYFHNPEDIVPYSLSDQKTFFRRIYFVWRLERLLKTKGIKTVIFNTASSRLEVVLLSFLLKRKIALFGITT